MESESLLLWRDEYSPADLARINQLPTATKIEMASQLLFRGLDQNRIAQILGLSPWIIAGWMRDEPEAIKAGMRKAMQRAAMLKLPAAWGKLCALIDSESEETRRKAISDIARIAGLAIDPASAQVAIGIASAGNLELKLDFKQMSDDELNRYREHMAALARGGPAASRDGGSGDGAAEPGELRDARMAGGGG